MGEAEERVRALHFRTGSQSPPMEDYIPFRTDDENLCYECHDDWPCDTIRALDEAKQEIAQRHKWWLDSNKMRADMEMRAIMAELERDAQTALVERLRLALEEIDTLDPHGFRDDDGVWHNRSHSLAQAALALTPEAALAELEEKQP